MTHRADPATGTPVCGGHGTIVDSHPTCSGCQAIEQDYPRLLWTMEQQKMFAEMFVATFRGGR